MNNCVYANIAAMASYCRNYVDKDGNCEFRKNDKKCLISGNKDVAKWK